MGTGERGSHGAGGGGSVGAGPPPAGTPRARRPAPAQVPAIQLPGRVLPPRRQVGICPCGAQGADQSHFDRRFPAPWKPRPSAPAGVQVRPAPRGLHPAPSRPSTSHTGHPLLGSVSGSRTWRWAPFITQSCGRPCNGDGPYWGVGRCCSPAGARPCLLRFSDVQRVTPGSACEHPACTRQHPPRSIMQPPACTGLRLRNLPYKSYHSKAPLVSRISQNCGHRGAQPTLTQCLLSASYVPALTARDQP